MRLHIAESCATKMASYITGRWITLVTLRDTNFVGELPRFAQDDNALCLDQVFSCSAMLEPTQVLSLLKSTPIIFPWLIRTRLFTRIGSCSLSGQTNIIRISSFDFGRSVVATNSAY